MAGPAAPVSHDGARALHDRFPVGVSHVSDQHVAGLHFVHLADVVHDAHGACANLLTDGATFGHHIALAFEFVAVLGCRSCLALHGLRAGLQYVELAVDAVFAPLDIHGATIVLFNHQGVLREQLHISVGQRVAVTQLSGDIGGFHQLAACCFFLGVVNTICKSLEPRLRRITARLPALSMGLCT